MLKTAGDSPKNLYFYFVMAVLDAQKELEALLWICFTPRIVLLIFEEKIYFFGKFFVENLMKMFFDHFGVYNYKDFKDSLYNAL